MTEEDIRELLAAIAQHDDREVTDLAVESWTRQARAGEWRREDALAAVHEFYNRPEPPLWDDNGGNEPRPVLPADIHRHHGKLP